MQPRSIQNWVFGIILVLLFLIVCRVFSPFFSVLLWSTLLYVLFSPLHQRITGKIKPDTIRGRIARTVLAALFSVFTVILIVVPLSFIVYQFFSQIRDLFRYAKAMFDENPGVISNIYRYASNFISRVTAGQITILPEQIDSQLKSIIGQGLQWSVYAGSGIIKNVGNFLVNLVFMVFCLFFFYLDGAYLSKLVQNIIPIRKDYMQQLVSKFKDTTRSLFLGYIMVAFIQGVVAFIIFIIFQVKGSLVFGILTIICAFIPMLGAAAIWLPLGIFMLVNGEYLRGIIFMLLCGGIVSSLDNFLRPLFLKDRVKLHPLVIFFSILGGIISFGFNGLILGPMLVIIFLTVLDLFLNEHKIQA